MSRLIFLDANVPIYAAGRDHALKQPCSEVLLLVAERPEAFVTDAEVLQELLHRYLALHLWPLGRDVIRAFAALMRERVEPVYVEDVEAAADSADSSPGLSARDLLHVAVMGRVGADRIVSADRGFDHIPRVGRLDPADVVAWRAMISDR